MAGLGVAHALCLYLALLFILCASTSVLSAGIAPCPDVCKCYAVRMINPWVRVDCRRARIDTLPRLKRDVRVLFCGETRVNTLRRETFVNASDIQYISIVDNPIKYVEDGALGLMTKLVNLMLVNNGLDDVYFLKDLTSLTDLQLSKNMLDKISPDAFRGMPHLKKLLLDRNRISEFHWNHDNLIFLDLSQNFITAFTEDSFSGLASLDELNLSGNLISRLKFIASQSLRVLRLRGNRINEISAVVWQRIPSLTQLDLSYNRISDLANISDVSALTELNVTNNLIRSFSGLNGLASLGRLNISHNMIKSVRGAPYLPLLQMIDLSNNELDVLDNSLLENAPILQTLRAENNNLMSLGSMVSSTSLQALHLRNNYIEHVDEDAFSSTSSLQYIDMGYNNITDVRALSSLPCLTTLNLTHNQIREFPSQTLQNCPELSVLDMTWNNLEAIPEFPSMYSPLELFLDHNPIRDAEWSKLRNIVRLKRLSMNWTEITHVPVATNMLYISHLSMKSSSIRTVDAGVFSTLVSIREICVDNIGISSLADLGSSYLLTKLKLRYGNLTEVVGVSLLSIEDVDISHNNISKIEISERSMPRLKYFMASHNSIDDISFVRFLTNIRFLDLGNNRISYVPINAFAWCRLLETLDLSSNSIMNMPVGVFDSNLSLKGLYLSNNLLTNFTLAFSGLPPSSGISKRVSYLYLDGNLLTSVDSGLTNSSKSIMKVNISNNPLQHIAADTFSFVPVINTLDVSNTPLEDLPPGLFGQNMFLKTLHFNNVTFLKHRMPFHLELPEFLSLNYLGMRHNQLTYLPNLVKTGILELDVSDNNLTDDVWQNVSGTEDMLILDISRNKLSSINKQAIQQHSLLARLNISGNKIQNLSSDLFTTWNQMSSIDMSNNQLSSVPPSSFEHLSARALVNLTGNQLLCNCNTRHLLERFDNQARFDEDAGNTLGAVTCQHPDRLRGRRIDSITTKDLLCAPTEDPAAGVLLATVGSVARLRCPVRDPTGVLVTWRLPIQAHPNLTDTPSLSQRGIGQQQQQHDQQFMRYRTTTVGELIIEDVSPEDEGTFTCNATNDQGSAVLRLRLLISGYVPYVTQAPLFSPLLDDNFSPQRPSIGSTSRPDRLQEESDLHSDDHGFDDADGVNGNPQGRSKSEEFPASSAKEKETSVIALVIGFVMMNVLVNDVNA